LPYTHIATTVVVSSELLVGYIRSVDNYSCSLFPQGSRRFGRNWKLAVEACSTATSLRANRVKAFAMTPVFSWKHFIITDSWFEFARL